MMTDQPTFASGRPRYRSPLILILGCAATPALSLGLGPAIQQSSLGQPLHLVVPIIAAAGDEMSGDCFRLSTAPVDADGVPRIAQARIRLERTAAGAQLVVTTTRAVNEPVIRVALEAGCDSAVRRDYTLLLDPAPIEPPMMAAEAPRAIEPATAAAAASAVAPATAARPAAGSSRASQPSRSRPKTASAGMATRKPPRAGSRASNADRLRISGPARVTRPTVAPGAGEGDRASAEIKAQQELALALEAETVVLRQRVNELSGMIERMEQEMRAATAARLAAEEAANAAPPAIVARWWESNWPLIAAVLGMASLIAGGLLWRRRHPTLPPGEWPISGLPASRFESNVADAPPAGSFTHAGSDPEPVAPAAQGLPTGGTPRPRVAVGRIDVAQAVAVSELSHVTEEARVYLALDRPDRAIEVLRQHIDDHSTNVPAAWLMLLDLYRSGGREQEFRRLAEDFHLHFNVQAPQWETFAGHSPDNLGLEAFPHLIEQLAALWGTEDCRSFLERLLYDNRQGRRIGFSLDAYDDILTLRQLLEALLSDSDSHEEAKLRAAWAAAQGATAAAPVAAATAAPTAARKAPRLPMTLDLELDLDEVVPPRPPKS